MFWSAIRAHTVRTESAGRWGRRRPIRSMQAGAIYSIALAVVLAACGTGTPEPDPGDSEPIDSEPITIGAVINLTGAQAALGEAQLRGLEMAIDEINEEGGIEGRHLELVTQDAGESPTTAVTAFNSVVESGARLVMGPVFGGQMEALLEPAADAQVPIFTNSGTASVTEHGSPWVFRWIPSDSLTKAAWVHFSRDYLEVERIGLLHISAAYGESAARFTTQTAEDLGMDLVGPEVYAFGDTDMSIQLRKLADEGAGAILVQGFAPDQAIILQQAHTMGLEQPIVMSMSTLAAGAFDIVEAEHAAGQFSEAGSAPQFRPDSEFADRFMARYEDPPDHMSLGQYAAMFLAAEAMRSAGPDATGEALADAIRSAEVTVDGLTLASDDAGNLAHSVEYLRFDDSKGATIVSTFEE